MPYGTVLADLHNDSLGNKLAPASSVFRNRIINGAMVISQRIGTTSTTISNATDTYYLDRYASYTGTNANNTIQQVSTAPAGFINSTLITIGTGASPAAGTGNYLYQNIEGLNITDLAWGTADAKTVTLSFWVRSSLTGTFSGALSNNGLNRSYPFTYTISSANTWTQASVTITGDTTGTWLTTNGVGIRVWFDLGSGSNFQGTAGSWVASDKRAATGSVQLVATSGATFYITGVQLEVGTNATSFDYRPYGTELALCQRYYEKSYDYSQVPGTTTDNVVGGTGIASSTTLIPASVYYKIPKRITGNTVTIYAYDGTSGSVTVYDSAGNSGATGATQNKVSEFGYTGVKKTGGTNFTAGAYYWWQWTSSAEL
jgi:hypothetical protein